ncbi:MAG: hypothetical protein V1663_02650 [archaeon]
MVKKIRCAKCGSTKIFVNVDSLITTYRCNTCGNISTIMVDKELERMYKKDKKKIVKKNLKNEIMP